ncbi:hypothetical protein XELAEV_18037496mg [Xenopus laevis]|uniref:Helix-turn-helix domain-containing protein n=1 Tax=Xenopus laevis TaxID=8355 RepID=A0A974CCY5_XENLA|nr:hypothetical protein XELAEV_18037496mg [Xenopus laevis]
MHHTRTSPNNRTKIMEVGKQGKVQITGHSTAAEFERMVQELNRVQGTIKFTCEYSEYKLAFLDVNVKIVERTWHTSIYYKPTDCNIILSPNSCHPPGVFKSLPYSQLSRVRRITSKDNLYEQDADAMITKFTQRRRKSIGQIISKKLLQVEKKTGFMTPLKLGTFGCGDCSHCNGIICGDTIAHPTRATPIKTNGNSSAVIYLIKFPCGYVGQTSRAVRLRLNEHKSNIHRYTPEVEEKIKNREKNSKPNNQLQNIFITINSQMDGIRTGEFA